MGPRCGRHAGGGGAVAWNASRDRTVAVPELVELDGTVAADAVRAAKLKPIVEREQSETVAPGRVIGQDPQPGSRLDRNDDVTIRVSSGPLPRQVPALVGLSVIEATVALEDVELTVGEVTTRFDEQAPEGQIVESVQSGEVPRDSAVDIVVSSGPEPRQVPNLSGMTPDQAKAALPDGLTGEIVEEFHPTVPAGQVIAANYKPSTPLPRGSVVKIRVSKGPELVPVPETSGASVSRATDALRAAGLAVAGVVGAPDAAVVRTDPPAGSPVRPGTPVMLVTGGAAVAAAETAAPETAAPVSAAN
jgi:eukaryotic-like serine/threonine-protein kinase